MFGICQNVHPDPPRMVANKSLCCITKIHHSRHCKNRRLLSTCGQSQNTIQHPDKHTCNLMEQTVQPQSVTSAFEERHPRPLALLTTTMLICVLCSWIGEKHERRAYVDYLSELSIAEAMLLQRQFEKMQLGAIAGIGAIDRPYLATY